MFERFEDITVRVGEVDIHAFVGGNGPPLLLLHGFPQNRYMWSGVAEPLAVHYRVVCADLRGYGDSGKPPAADDLSNYSFRAMAHDQLQLMRQLGCERFHLVGHDRGGRTGHRLALDHPEALRSLAVLDIAPTHAMFAQADKALAEAYWHWYFLQQPAPYPERVIAADPDHFYEGCLYGWGAGAAFDPAKLQRYRDSWRQEAAIFGSCADYRAAARVDFALDADDLPRRVACPTLAFWGTAGKMHRLFDMEREWAGRCEQLAAAKLPGGHFFIDQFPERTLGILRRWLGDVDAGCIAPRYDG